VVFDKQGKKELFSYFDEHTVRDSVLISIAAQASFLSYYHLVYPSTMSLVGFGTATIFFLGLSFYARHTPVQINLLKDGKHVEVYRYTSFGRPGKKPVKIPIEEIKGGKGSEGYQLQFKKKTYYIPLDGKLSDPELLLAVLRGLRIDSSQFVSE
jgi:hypothetical protein